jgi:NAD(P)-dependent dehydrogenase (short-subunit alcohol dehydrogenase family)
VVTLHTLSQQGRRPTPETSRATLAVNYHGAVTLTEAVLPLLPPGARIVNVSSGAAQQNQERMAPERRAQLLSDGTRMSVPHAMRTPL